MSAMNDYAVELQERATYQDGWNAAFRGEIRHCFVLSGKDREAWLLGYDDCVTEHTSP